MTDAVSAALGRIVRGETALHRRVRREALVLITFTAAVVIYRML